MRLITLVLCCLISSLVWGQEESEIKELEQTIRDQINASAKSSYQARILMRLDALAAKFELSDKQLKKAKLYAKKVASDQVRDCEAQINQFLTETFAKHGKTGLVNSVISVNGKTIANKDASRTFSFVVDIPKRWIQWSGDAGGSGSWLDMHEPVDFSQEAWRKPFVSTLSAEQLSWYQDEFEVWQRRQMAESAVKQSPDFGFNPEQVQKILEAISPSMRTTNQSTLTSLARFLDNTSELHNLAGDFLSPSQMTLIKYHGNKYAIQQQQGDYELIDGQSLADAVEGKLREKINSVILAGMQVELEEYIRLLKPAPKIEQRWRVLVKGIASDSGRAVIEDSQQSLESLLALFQPGLSGYVWDGQGYALADGEPDESEAKDQITMGLGKVDRRFWLHVMVKGNRQRLNFSTKSHSDFKLEKRPRWIKEIERIDAADLDRMEEMKQEKMRRSVVEVVTATLSVDLVLTQTQADSLRVLLEKECESQVARSVAINAKQTMKALAGLEFLTEAQQDYFQVVLGRLN